MNSRMRVELRRARGPAVLLLLGILAGLGAIGALIARENVHLPWESEYTAQIAVSNATGVEPGLDEVRWAGIVVGRITGEKFVNGEPVITAQMRSSDLTSRGHASAGLLGSKQILQASQTQTPVNVADVLNTFSEPVRDRLQELLDELGTGLSPAGGQQLRYAYGDIASLLVAQKQLSDTIASRSSFVRLLVDDGRDLFTALNERNTELDGLVQHGSVTLSALGSESGALSRLIGELPGTLDQIHGSFGQLQTTLGVVRPALTDLLPTARALPTGLHALKTFARAATPALKALNPAINALEPLAKNLPGTARALNASLTELEPQVPRLDTITAAILPCEFAVDKFFAYSLSTLKFNNVGNQTASPRGTLVTGALEASTVKDPAISPAVGCADNKPAATTGSNPGS
jgi:phospholipid/cholesterol/gamma-HCH transport system substrate-binding protein